MRLSESTREKLMTVLSWLTIFFFAGLTLFALWLLLWIGYDLGLTM